MANPVRILEASVGFMTHVPEIGHLEFIVHYSTDVIPTQQEVLAAITPAVLRVLGHQQADWNITNVAMDLVNMVDPYNFTYGYSFEWMHLNNKERTNSFMRTSTFRPHHHRFEINL